MVNRPCSLLICSVAQFGFAQLFLCVDSPFQVGSAQVFIMLAADKNISAEKAFAICLSPPFYLEKVRSSCKKPKVVDEVSFLVGRARSPESDVLSSPGAR